MGLFGNRETSPVDDGRIDEMVDELRSLSASVAVLTGEKEGLEQEKELRQEIERLQERAATAFKEKTTKEIELDRVKEDHAREKREIEHKVGLHKKQVELDIEVARRQTELEIREGNLAAERSRFESDMEFMKERFGEEVEYLHGVVETILGRIPEVKVERTFHTQETIGEPAKKGSRKPAAELTA